MIFSSRCFLQKTNERILLYYYETSGRLVFVRFLEEIEDTKKTFRNYLTFKLEKTISRQKGQIMNEFNLAEKGQRYTQSQKFQEL